VSLWGERPQCNAGRGVSHPDPAGELSGRTSAQPLSTARGRFPASSASLATLLAEHNEATFNTLMRSNTSASIRGTRMRVHAAAAGAVSRRRGVRRYTHPGSCGILPARLHTQTSPCVWRVNDQKPYENTPHGLDLYKEEKTCWSRNVLETPRVPSMNGRDRYSCKRIQPKAPTWI
jgi:hypothetical protein